MIIEALIPLRAKAFAAIESELPLYKCWGQKKTDPSIYFIRREYAPWPGRCVLR